MTPTNGKRLICAVAAVGGLVFVLCAFLVERDGAVLVEIGVLICALAVLGMPWGEQ